MKNTLKALAIVGAGLLAGNALLAESVTLSNGSGRTIPYAVVDNGSLTAQGTLETSDSVAIELNSGSMVIIGALSRFGTLGQLPIHILTVNTVQADATLDVTTNVLDVALNDGTYDTIYHKPTTLD